MQDNSKYDEELNSELRKRITDELSAYDNKNCLEQYALYMLRVQMYELSIKQDLSNLFGLKEDKVERMSLGGIARYFRENKIKANEGFFTHLQHIIQQRNSMAHDFLASNSALASIVGEAATNRAERKLSKAIYELENVWQYYVILKENDLLYDPSHYKSDEL